VALQEMRKQIKAAVIVHNGKAEEKTSLAEAWEAHRLARTIMAEQKAAAGKLMEGLPETITAAKRAELAAQFESASAEAAAEEARLEAKQEAAKAELDVASSVLLELSQSMNALSRQASALEERVKDAEATLGASRAQWKLTMKLGAAATAQSEEVCPGGGNTPGAGAAGEPLHMEQLGKQRRPRAAFEFLASSPKGSEGIFLGMSLLEAAKAARMMCDIRAVRDPVLAMAAVAQQLSISQADVAVERFLEALGDAPGLRDTTAPGQAAALEIRKHPFELTGADAAEASRRAEAFLNRAWGALQQFPRERTVWDSITSAAAGCRV
jgi:hypothetical protein